MRHTQWIDQCGKELALRAEYPTDSNLVAYLDVQSLVRKAQVMLEDSLSDHLIHSRQLTWQQVFELMEKQKTEERLLPCQGTNDNCKSPPPVPIHLSDLTRNQGPYASSSVPRIYLSSVTLFDGRETYSISTRWVSSKLLPLQHIV